MTYSSKDMPMGAIMQNTTSPNTTNQVVDFRLSLEVAGGLSAADLDHIACKILEAVELEKSEHGLSPNDGETEVTALASCTPDPAETPDSLIGKDVFILQAKTDGKDGRAPCRTVGVCHSKDAAIAKVADLKQTIQADEALSCWTPLQQPNDLQVFDAEGKPLEFYTFSKHEII